MPLQPCRRAWVTTVNPQVGEPNDRASPMPPSAEASNQTVPACLLLLLDGELPLPVQPVCRSILPPSTGAGLLSALPKARGTSLQQRCAMPVPDGVAVGLGCATAEAAQHHTGRANGGRRPTLPGAAGRSAVGDSLLAGRAVIYSDTHGERAEDVAERSTALAKVHFWAAPCPLGPRATREQGCEGTPLACCGIALLRDEQ